MKRYLNATAAALVAAIASGAVVTSGNPGFTTAHQVLGVGAGLMMLGLIRLGPAGWIALALAALEMVPAGPVLHACLAPLILASVVFLRTQPRADAVPADGLAKFAKVLPFLVLGQIAMGAAYRHKAWGVMPHMGGAMIVATSSLILCMLLIQRRPDMKPPAVHLMSIVLTQVTFGIAAFVLRLLEIDKGIWFTILTVAHVVTGAMALSATVWLTRLMNPSPLNAA